MFHFPGFAPPRLWIQRGVSWVCHEGLPHSGIPGSKPASGSPRLIAAGHALHRLLMPGHPPYALCSLTKSLPLIAEALPVLLVCVLRNAFVPDIQLSKSNGTVAEDSAGLLKNSLDLQIAKISHPRAGKAGPALRSPPAAGCGAERDRTADPLLAKQVLSQLSYSPDYFRDSQLDCSPLIMGLPGVEPGTSRLSGVRSNHLSYRPSLNSSGPQAAPLNPQ